MLASNNPQWAIDFIQKEFSSGPCHEWCNQARTWLKRFCNEIGATNFEFHKNHYEFYGFFLYNGQYWYYSSGDCRFKLMKSLLIRKAKHNRDFTGGHNQFVPYNNKNLKFNLEMIVKEVPFYEYTGKDY